MQKKVVVSGYYGFENFGDEAILCVLTQELKKNDISVTVISKSPEVTSKKLNVDSIYTFSIKNIIKTLKNSDVLISGGGSLLQDVTSMKSLFYYLFVIAIAIFYKKDVIIFAQGIGPIKNKIGQLFTKCLLKKCKYITVRDKKSLALLNSWGVCSDLVSDPVWNFSLQPFKPQNKVGIQLRSWSTLPDKFLQKLASVVAQKFFDKEIVIYSFQDALDLDVCKKFQAYLSEQNPNIKLILHSAMSIDETVKSFSELDCLIAMRYHACLLSLKYGIPTLALSYDEKVEKIADRFSLPCSFLNVDEDLSDLIEKMMKLNPNVITEKANECRFSFENIIKYIK